MQHLQTDLGCRGCVGSQHLSLQSGQSCMCGMHYGATIAICCTTVASDFIHLQSLLPPIDSRDSRRLVNTPFDLTGTSDVGSVWVVQISS